MNPQPVWHVDPDKAVYLKALLQFEGPQREGWLRCACTGPYQIFLDGEQVGSGPGGELTQVPGWDHFEVTTEAAATTSTLMVRAAAGPEAAWFICEGQLSGASVLTDPTWSGLAGTSPDSETGFDETYSAILEPLHGDVESPAWKPCRIAEAPPPASLPPVIITTIDMAARQLVASGESGLSKIPSVRDLAPLTSCKCVHPDGLLRGHGQRTTIRTTDPGIAACVILDFGRQVHGTPFLSVQTEAGGGVVDLFFGASPDGFDSALRYICRVGRQRWTGLHSHSFRFLLARFSGFTDADCLVEQLGVRVRRVESAAEDASGEGGTIDGDEQLEALWDVGGHSSDACRQQVYRLDAYPAPYDWLSALPLFLNDCSHRGDPTEGRAMLSSTGPPQGSASDLRRWLGYPLFVEAYLQYSGDRDTVSGSLGTVTQVLELIQQRRLSSGLLPESAPWAATRATITAAGAVNAAIRLFDSFSLKAESRTARECFDSLLASTQSCWSPETQLYHEGGNETAYTQLTNALVLYFGLADETRRQQILAAMRGPGVETVRGLDEAFYLVAGAWEAGAHQRALQYLHTYWGRLLDREGPTWLDKQNRVTAAGAAPGPDYFLASRVMGVRPAALRHDCTEIEPPSTGLSHMTADSPTRHGVMHVEWWRPESQPTCRIEVRTERDARLRLCMPRIGIRFPDITINDQTVWRNDKVVPNPWVHEIDAEPERIVLTVSGTRSFAAHLS